MRDPVADILAERSALGSGLSGAVALSILLHVAGAAFAVRAALRQPAQQPVAKLNIRFANIPREAPAAAVPAEKPAAPRIQDPAPQPAKPPEKAAEPPRKNTVPLSSFGKSPKKGAEVPAPPPPPPPAAAAGGVVGEVGIGEAGVTGLEGGDFPYTLYLDQMKRLVGSRWVRPQIAAGATTIVYFRIERDGTIRDARMMTGSGIGGFDRAALRAVLEASPLPPLPSGYSGYYLGVHLTFR